MTEVWWKRVLRRLLQVLGSSSLWLLVACDETEPTQPLEFGYFIHPGTLDAGSPGEVKAGVLVGNDGCWHLGGASLVRQGNRLVMSGYAAGEPGEQVCPTVRVYATLTLQIPPLGAGEYLLQGSDLVDTLYVANPAPRPPGKFFAAHGRVTEGACMLFAPSVYPGSEEISGIVPPFSIPGDWPPLPWDVMLVGSVAATDSCAEAEHSLLRVRSLRFAQAFP